MNCTLVALGFIVLDLILALVMAHHQRQIESRR